MTKRHRARVSRGQVIAIARRIITLLRCDRTRLLGFPNREFTALWCVRFGMRESCPVRFEYNYIIYL